MDITVMFSLGFKLRIKDVKNIEEVKDHFKMVCESIDEGKIKLPNNIALEPEEYDINWVRDDETNKEFDKSLIEY